MKALAKIKIEINKSTKIDKKEGFLSIKEFHSLLYDGDMESSHALTDPSVVLTSELLKKKKEVRVVSNNELVNKTENSVFLSQKELLLTMKEVITENPKFISVIASANLLDEDKVKLESNYLTIVYQNALNFDEFFIVKCKEEDKNISEHDFEINKKSLGFARYLEANRFLFIEKNEEISDLLCEITSTEEERLEKNELLVKIFTLLGESKVIIMEMREELEEKILFDNNTFHYLFVKKIKEKYEKEIINLEEKYLELKNELEKRFADSLDLVFSLLAKQAEEKLNIQRYRGKNEDSSSDEEEENELFGGEEPEEDIITDQVSTEQSLSSDEEEKEIISTNPTQQLPKDKEKKEIETQNITKKST